MSRTTPLILLGLSALLLGALVLVDPASIESGAAPADSRTRSDDGSQELRELRRKLDGRDQRIADLEERLRERETVAHTGPGAPGAPVGEGTAGDLVVEQDDYVRRTIAARADAIRRQGEKIRSQAELSAAYQLAREIAAERIAAVDRKRGGVLGWLDAPGGALGTPEELTGSSEAMTKFTARQIEGPAVEGPTLGRKTVLPDGAQLRFGAGTYTLNVRALNDRKPFPQDVLISGQGMNETLLRLGDEFGMRTDVYSLTFRDVTLHANSQYFERMRSNRFTLRMERCRVIGFDKGSGHSTMLAGDKVAFFATDCRFEAGFGGSPGSGHLFSVGGMLAARLEDCVIVGPLDPFGTSSRGFVQFVRCKFDRMPPRARSLIESGKGNSGLVLEECTVTPTEPTRDRRALSEFNPAWK